MSFSRRNLLQNAVAGAGLAMGVPKAHGKGSPQGLPPAASGGSALPGSSDVQSGPDPLFEKRGPITLADLAQRKTIGVAAAEVNDYAPAHYQGELVPSPPHAEVSRHSFAICSLAAPSPGPTRLEKAPVAVHPVSQPAQAARR